MGEDPGYASWDVLVHHVAKQKVALEVKASFHLDVSWLRA